MICRLAYAVARNRALDAVKNAPDGFVVTVREPTRNLEQNAALHALLQEIAESRQWAGQPLDVEDWKRLLTAAWMRATGRGIRLVPALDGQGFDALYQRTSTLTKSEMSELISYIEAWATTEKEHGEMVERRFGNKPLKP